MCGVWCKLLKKLTGVVAEALHQQYICCIFFSPSTLRNSWCQLKNSERDEPLCPECQQEYLAEHPA